MASDGAGASLTRADSLPMPPSLREQSSVEDPPLPSETTPLQTQTIGRSSNEDFKFLTASTEVRTRKRPGSIGSIGSSGDVPSWRRSANRVVEMWRARLVGVSSPLSISKLAEPLDARARRTWGLGGVVGLSAFALFIAHHEGWSFKEAVYFEIVTLTTVGYGDYVPVTDEGKLATCVLILLGIAFFGTAFGFFISSTVDDLVDREDQLFERARRWCRGLRRFRRGGGKLCDGISSQAINRPDSSSRFQM